MGEEEDRTKETEGREWTSWDREKEMGVEG
jgi:hypothetical protein